MVIDIGEQIQVKRSETNLAMTVAGSLWPSLRAARVDPATSLRSD
jgi:ABC-type lipoprotein release transport system permease subunit